MDPLKNKIFFCISADEKFDSTMRVNAVVQHTGDVLYVPPGIFKSICPFNIAAFPFVSLTKKYDLDCFLSFFGYTKLYIEIWILDT